MTKPCNRYYAAAFPDQERKGVYYASFGTPGQPPKWLLRKDGERQEFNSHDEAELAGWRYMAGYLNRASGAQVFEGKTRRSQAFRNFDPIHPLHGRLSEADRVFRKDKPT